MAETPCAPPPLTAQCRAAVVEASQEAQNTIGGYPCDYATKAQPQASHQVNQYVKAHEKLLKQLREQDRGNKSDVAWEKYVNGRFTKRLFTDFLARGVLRGGVEVLNLLLNSDSKDVTNAETFKSAPVVNYPAYAFLARHTAETKPGANAESVSVPFKVHNPRKSEKRKQVGEPKYEAAGDFPYIYGCRPRGTDVFFVSPYEFTMDWEVCLNCSANRNV